MTQGMAAVADDRADPGADDQADDYRYCNTYARPPVIRTDKCSNLYLLVVFRAGRH